MVVDDCSMNRSHPAIHSLAMVAVDDCSASSNHSVLDNTILFQTKTNRRRTYVHTVLIKIRYVCSQIIVQEEKHRCVQKLRAIN